jgi:hypothetical protein
MEGRRHSGRVGIVTGLVGAAGGHAKMHGKLGDPRKRVLEEHLMLTGSGTRVSVKRTTGHKRTLWRWA